ncbi:conserved hypothetical protein [Streptococcus equi subsp. zooepidemicus ATCC 35246]|nr:conserved hypothetical protein [Streptococcus equi subsp. zooepidemicus ATCC 35246]AIA68798.1 hypothetical protein Q426_05905 [Streptococcus equi subsp. zooepidemicus CY]
MLLVGSFFGPAKLVRLEGHERQKGLRSRRKIQIRVWLLKNLL